MKEKQTGQDLLPLRKMAAKVGVPGAWLKEQAEAGNVPGLRAGNRWLFVPEAVTETVKAMAGDPASHLFAPEQVSEGKQ